MDRSIGLDLEFISCVGYSMPELVRIISAMPRPDIAHACSTVRVPSIGEISYEPTLK